MSIMQDPKSNHLLAALPAADRERLAPYLMLVELPLGHVVYESGDQLRSVYFPTNAIISLLYVMEGIDRLPSNDLTMTQELIANMLGVRRSGVTEAALKLQAAGLIRYSHGHIAVLDRAGLEQRVCECYAVVKREFERLLPDILKI